jgi:iron complex outermembrane receptor protein
MTFSKIIKAKARCLVAASLVTSVHVSAQDAAPQAEVSGSDGLEEIVVSARRTEENLQRTPIAITALTGDALEIRQVMTVTEIGAFVPNVNFQSGTAIAGSTNTVALFIRGIGQTDFNLTIDPGVGLYVDGVYVSRSVGALLDTVDLERVEVLRGPQGTLFGKNTIGGAVSLTTRQPGDSFGATLEGTAGNYNRADVRAAVDVPVSDILKLRFTGSLQTRDGYVERLSDGDRMGNKNSLSGRLVALFTPADDWSFTVAVDGTRAREQAIGSTLLAANEDAGFPFFFNKILNSATCGPPGTPTPRNDSCYTSRWITGDPFKSWAGDRNRTTLDVWGVSLVSQWSPGTVLVKSISAYRKLDSTFNLDGDNSPLPIFRTGNSYSQAQFSQELQVSGSGIEDRLNWLVGAYYLNETGTDRNDITASVADFLSGGKVTNDSYAVFAQTSFEIVDGFRVTVGGRYTKEKKRFLPDQFITQDRTGGSLLLLSRCFVRQQPIVPPDPICDADPAVNPDGNRILPFTEVQIDAGEFTPALTLDYQMSEDIFVYASYSRGFKAGGFTQRIFPPEPQTPSFGPETATAWEMGVKAELLDRRLRFNAAAFTTDYSNLQVIVNEGIAPKVRNAGRARIDGFELEMEAAPIPAIRLNASVGYLDARYREVSAAAAPITLESELPEVPAWTGAAGATATVLERDWGSLRLRGDWTYKGAHFKDAINSPEVRQSGVSLFSASVTALLMDETLALSVGGTNLSDQRYLITGFQELETQGNAYGVFARPREWFVRLRYNLR